MSSQPTMVRRLRLAQALQRRLEDGLVSASGDRILELAGFAANLAWMAHGGAFALPSVERALKEGPGLEGGRPRLNPASVEGRTLHVLTTAYETGGHTRLAQRWMELMHPEPCAVVLVDQREPVAADWVVPSGGGIPLLDFEREGIRSRLDKVATLLALMQSARRVVFHIHPDDAVSVAAGHQARGVDLCFLNHADHVAWLGASLPALLLGGRRGGNELAVHRRGIDPAMCGYVPLPLTEPIQMDRGEARKSLGIGEAEVVLLTLASGYKYLPVEGRSLLEPLSLVLRNPAHRLIAIGPDPEHPVFTELARRHPGRVQALGIIRKPDLYRAAADIYIDSFPFCSTTSLLENILIGTPVVAFQPDPDELGIFYSDWPNLPGSLFGSPDPEGFAERVEALAESRARRLEVGGRLRKAVEIHLSEPWRESMLTLQKSAFTPRPWSGRVPVEEGILDRTLAGLGRDPFRYPRLSKWPLGFLEKVGVGLDRLRG